MSAPTRFSDEVERVLRAAGWEPGRNVSIEPWRRMFEGSNLHMHEAAEHFLSEFGGLTVNPDGPGISRAPTQFELDPGLADGEEERFSEWSEEIGETIVPIGELDRGRYFLGIDTSARIYIVTDWVSSFGEMPEAFEKLIIGIAATVVRE
ncbi:SUKH-3 domain-containing protein [Kitasatospora sp. HPMI-4]|uniref:SUKH-3 domain-containing protein n=1 Tax=Kitasatospora sp. HPMI-4 TaxID=3448443 RepID=UPI003F1D269C